MDVFLFLSFVIIFTKFDETLSFHLKSISIILVHPFVFLILLYILLTSSHTLISTVKILTRTPSHIVNAHSVVVRVISNVINIRRMICILH